MEKRRIQAPSVRSNRGLCKLCMLFLVPNLFATTFNVKYVKRSQFISAAYFQKPVGQLHKNSPVFLDLPALMVKKSHRFRSKQKTSGSVVSISDLFEPDSN